MPQLPARIAKLDDVAEPVREFYIASGDGFVLDAADADQLPAVQGLKSKRDELLQSLRATKDRLAEFDGLDAAEARRLKERAEKAVHDTSVERGEFDQVRERMIAAHKAETEKIQAEQQRLRSVIRDLVVEDQLTRAIEGAGFLPEYRHAVRALMKENRIEVEQEGDTYRGIVKGDAGDTEIGDHVKQWAATTDAAPYLPASGKAGSGTPRSQPRAQNGGPNRYQRIREAAEKSNENAAPANQRAELHKRMNYAI